MAAGFVHGVLNTDNMNITGESFDYGPYRFLPRNDPNFVAAYFDQTGLYSFGRQPEAVFWNLQPAGRLPDPGRRRAEPLVEALDGFAAAYRRALTAAMLDRLGLQAAGDEADIALVNAAFRALAEGGERAALGAVLLRLVRRRGVAGRALAGPRAGLYGGEAFSRFRALLGRLRDPTGRSAWPHPISPRAEPEELLIDEIEAIWTDIAERDDWSRFEAKLAGVGQAAAAMRLGG